MLSIQHDRKSPRPGGPFASILFYVLLAGCATSWEPASACTTPVFTYALYRWMPDVYEIVVFHRGPCLPAEQGMIDALHKSASDAPAEANCLIRTVDLDTPLNQSMRQLWNDQSGATLPWMVVRYQRGGYGAQTDFQTVFAAHLDGATARVLTDSPVRRRIAEKILRGDVTVWVLLESGNKVEDDKAADLLRSQLTEVADTLEQMKQPEGIPGQTPGGEDGVGGEEDDADGAITFSMIRVSRTDPAERMLIEMLLSSEPDLRSFADPMAFPVFGRGRVLYALVGKGINEENIGQTCAFLVDGCSCIVKAQNPGMDLLMSMDWEAALEKLWSNSPQTTPAAEVPTYPTSMPSGASQDDALITDDKSEFPAVLLRNSLIGLAIGLVVVAVVALMLNKRHRPTQR